MEKSMRDTRSEGKQLNIVESGKFGYIHPGRRCSHVMSSRKLRKLVHCSAGTAKLRMLHYNSKQHGHRGHSPIES